MNVLEEAIKFATDAHSGQIRKMTNTPYILHPLEVAAIISTMTADLDVMAAGVLHDTVEDCDVDPKEIKRLFGARVSALVQSETEDRTAVNKTKAESWQERKEESLLILKLTKDIDVKRLWLGDKLSNMRSFYREYQKKDDDMWLALNQKDKSKQEWYYRSIIENIGELSDTAAYKEFCGLVNQIFADTEDEK